MKNKFQTKWDFKLFYNEDNDSNMEKDLKSFEKSVSSFEKKYKNNLEYLFDVDQLFKALEEYEHLSCMPEAYKPLHYFQLKKDINSNDNVAQAKLLTYTDRLNKELNKINFFKLNLGKVEVLKQKEFLQNKKLEKYHYFLERIFINAKYNLSEQEEKVISLLDTPANSMWVSGFSKLLSSKVIRFKGKDIPIHEASSILSSLNTKDRRLLGEQLNKKYKEMSNVCELEINAIFTHKKILDELRGFENAYQSTVVAYENDEKVIDNLVEVVTKNFNIAHRFYKTKAKILKENKLRYSDRGAKVGNFKRSFSFEDSTEIVSSAFEKFGSEYKNIFKDFLSKGQIDVYPALGKKGGAYCWGIYGMPTVVFLNHTNDFKSLMTLAHEMGHAFHYELSYTQSPIYSEYTMSVAETASTLFENFVFDEVFEKLSEKEKIIALHNKINDSVSTIFRQIACFNFEKELHETIRKNGYIAKDNIAMLMNKHMKSYLGPVFELKEEDGYFFVDWSHIRRYFYVYSYAFGNLISDALYLEYKKDSSFKEKIEQFLKSGGSKSPEDIFGDIGIDIRNKNFFENGLKIIEEDVKKLEKLVGLN